MDLEAQHREPWFQSFFRGILVACAVFGVLIALPAGCQCQKAVSPASTVLENTQSDEDHLSDAIKNLSQLHEQPITVGYKQVEFHLNEWLRRQDPLPEWTRDPMADRVPKDFEAMVSREYLENEKFDLAPDIAYLDENYTLQQAAKWIVASPGADPDFTAWLESVRTGLGNNAADDLSAAEKLFDWTIRNLQLDPLLTTKSAAGPELPGAAAQRPHAPPGATRSPLQSMMFGHGDAWERARTFIGLCRQHGLLAVVVGFPEETSGAMRPWAVGVEIEKQLYLFDPALGLPIPGEKGQGIATLDEIRAKPELLRQLDVEKSPYPIKESELSSATALIEADPLALSRRMYQFEKKLPRAKRMSLTIAPSAVAQQLRQIKSLADVRLWSVPFQTHLYKGLLHTNRDWTQEQEKEMLPYLGPPLGMARRLHLAGKIDDSDRVGAKRVYMESRPTEDRVPDFDREDKHDEILAPFAMRDPSVLKNPGWRKATLELLRDQLTQMKMQTSYWLGIAAFDARQYSAAINHLQLRVLEKLPGSKRESGALYNLARSYEALGQYDNARSVYRQDTSPQRAGSLIRAKRLEGKMPPAKEH